MNEGSLLIDELEGFSFDQFAYNTTMSQITLKNLGVSFTEKKKETIVFSHLNASFLDASVNIILGKSGCGKTTLLKCLMGKLNYDGSILFDGVAIDKTPTEKRNISYVSQEYALYPHFTVFENIAFPLRLLNTPRKEIEERVYAIAKDLGLYDCLSRKPRYLSGGQQQRAAIARALVKKSNVFLLDEPLSNLDLPKKQETRLLLKRLFESMKPTVLYVTHDFSEALDLGDKLFVLDEGKLVFEGSPEEALFSPLPAVAALRSDIE